MDPFVLPEVWNPQTDPGAATAAAATRWANPISSSCCFNAPWCERDGLQPPNPSTAGMFLIAHIRQRCLVNTWMMEGTSSKVKRSFWIHFRSSSLWRFLSNEVRQVKNWLLGKQNDDIATYEESWLLRCTFTDFETEMLHVCVAPQWQPWKSPTESCGRAAADSHTVCRGFLQKAIPRLLLCLYPKGGKYQKRGRNPVLCQ